MATVIKYKQRLSSVKSTKKITKAMELVASAKLRKARQIALQNKFFKDTTYEAMYLISRHSSEFDSLYLKQRPIQKIAYVVFGSDVGLCGSYNINILKIIKAENEKGKKVKLYVIGSKLVDKIAYDGIKIHKAFRGIIEGFNNQQALDIATSLIYDYKIGEIDQIKIVYTKYLSPIKQEAICDDVLPLTMKEEHFKLEKLKDLNQIAIVEPNSEQLFEKLVPQYITSYLIASYHEAVASEHSNRRNAMENANNNADELIEKLVLKINQIRQANITQEISEIVSGSEAQKG